MSNTKRCYSCKRTLLLSEFHKNRSRPDGHNSECKECAKRRSRVYGQTIKGYRPLLPRLSSELRANFKRCPQCGVIKPLSDFYNSSNRHDGHSWECKQCENARKKASITRKKLTHAQIVRKKKKSRVANSSDSRKNLILDKIVNGVQIKDLNRVNLPDDPKQEDIMDKPNILLPNKNRD